MELLPELSTSKTFFLISAILNLVGAAFWIISGPFIIAGTCGVGCLLFFIPILNIVCTIMDFNSYGKLNSLNKKGTFQTMQFTAIIEICTILCFNLVSLVFGIITLTHLNKDNVKVFLKEKGVY
jgi:hypothetical protein